MRQFLICILIIISAVPLKSQKLKPADTLLIPYNLQLDKYFELENEEEDDASLKCDIEQLEDDPIDINTAAPEELNRIPYVTNLAAIRIIENRKSNEYKSLEDLSIIEGITPEMLCSIRMFSTVKPSRKKSQMKANYNSRVSVETEKRKGFLNNSYQGSPVRSLNKLQLSAGFEETRLLSIISTMQAGILTKKDPGEKSYKDFINGYGYIEIPALYAKMVFGSYQIKAAEGLVLWRASSMTAGNDVIKRVRKNGDGIRPYLSSSENLYFRGTAFSIDIDRLQIQMFYSNRPLNAGIDTMGRISSFYQSGLFRTENEIAKKNATRETFLGGRISIYTFDGIKIGCTGYRTRFAHPLMLKTKNDESVNDLWMTGIDASYTNLKFDLFTEVAADRYRRTAFLFGANYNPALFLSMSFIARKYPEDFQNIYGNAFGGTNQNENGVYTGIAVQPAGWIRFSMYYDQYVHAGRSGDIPVPSNGSDFLALAELTPNKDFDFSIRFKRKEGAVSKDCFDLSGRTVKQVIPRIQVNWRLSSRVMMSSLVSLISRIEWIKVRHNGIINPERGILISAALKCKPSENFDLRARIAVMETDSYDSRLYEYEDDLTNTTFSPALYGRGIRWYFTGRVCIYKDFEISVKYARTIKEGIMSIGSGLDEISGNTQSILSMQLNNRF
ncbi:MAG: helix-hairpin-helix domain-containing protein [Bacteroidetes bacterium]|nr:helix-hairpin-helix domain-containing protein [Bacteroidota bacterium]